jgi:hypothetical protein
MNHMAEFRTEFLLGFGKLGGSEIIRWCWHLQNVRGIRSVLRDAKHANSMDDRLPQKYVF